jgi:hypothetical protein
MSGVVVASRYEQTESWGLYHLPHVLDSGVLIFVDIVGLNEVCEG